MCVCGDIGAGMNSLDPSVVFSPRHLSLPSDSSSLTDAIRQASSNSTLGLGDTGKIISSALSDSYLPNIGLDESQQVGKSVCFVSGAYKIVHISSICWPNAPAYSKLSIYKTVQLPLPVLVSE